LFIVSLIILTDVREGSVINRSNLYTVNKQIVIKIENT